MSRVSRALNAVDFEDTILIDEDEEMADPSTPDKRGRGRPPTTGAYYVKQEADRLARERDEREKSKRILDSAVPFEDKTGKMAKLTAAIKEEMEEAPEDDIFSRLLQGANSIMKVTQLSGNLKGEFQGLLKHTAAEVRAASCALNERLARERDSPEDEFRKELASLRKELFE